MKYQFHIRNNYIRNHVDTIAEFDSVIEAVDFFRQTIKDLQEVGEHDCEELEIVLYDTEEEEILEYLEEHVFEENRGQDDEESGNYKELT